MTGVMSDTRFKYCFVFCFPRKNKTETTRNIYSTYDDLLKANKFQIWFRRFEFNDLKVAMGFGDRVGLVMVDVRCRKPSTRTCILNLNRNQ